jgi:hypothetical protein
MADSKLALPSISPSTSLFLIRAWVDAVENAARHTAPNGLVYGLLPLVNLPLYNALSGAPAWGPEPVIDGLYPALGNADQKKTWSAEKQVFDVHSAAKNTLTVAIWASIEPSMIQILRRPVNGFHTVTIHAVVDHIRSRYGRLTPALFAQMKEYLRNRMRSDVPLEDVLAEHHQIYILSLSIEQALSESDRVRYLQMAVADIPDYAHAIRSYLHAHGDIAAQTFSGLEAELLIASRNMASTTTAHLGLSAMAPAAAPAAFGAATGATNTAGGSTGSGRNARVPAAATATGAAPPSARTPPTDHHCWFHGDCGHAGVDCNKKDTPGFNIHATKANPGTRAVGPWSQVRLTKN